MNSQILKSELEKINYANLFIESGQKPDYVDKIRRRFNLQQGVEILGFIDTDHTLKGEAGVLITDSGIQWILPGVKIDDNDRDKGSLPYEELGKYTCQARAKFIKNAITLTKRDISDGKYLSVEMPFDFDINLDDKAKEEQVFFLEKTFAAIISLTGISNSIIPDEKNTELIEAFIGDKDNAVFYKKAFAKYSVNGIEKFTFCFSWGGFIFGALNLFHRKLYIEGVIWLVGSAILAGISSGFLSIILFFAGAFVNPFLIYKRYKRILAQCNSLAYDQKIETLRTMGGTNRATTVIFSLALLIALVVFVVFMVRACIG
jgi:hypothetical protein